MTRRMDDVTKMMEIAAVASGDIAHLMCGAILEVWTGKTKVCWDAERWGRGTPRGDVGAIKGSAGSFVHRWKVQRGQVLSARRAMEMGRAVHHLRQRLDVAVEGGAGFFPYWLGTWKMKYMRTLEIPTVP